MFLIVPSSRSIFQHIPSFPIRCFVCVLSIFFNIAAFSFFFKSKPSVLIYIICSWLSFNKDNHFFSALLHSQRWLFSFYFYTLCSVPPLVIRIHAGICFIVYQGNWRCTIHTNIKISINVLWEMTFQLTILKIIC